ncbi:MAG: hypothetical protein IJ783_10695, partial [Kiritimatiellae bacterium]|nr:hypothetical protein [Kiritimatiellia bacterium]
LGWDAGRVKAPPPRKILVSREFLSLLARTGGLPVSSGRAAAGDFGGERLQWLPRTRSEFPENLVLVR